MAAVQGFHCHESMIKERITTLKDIRTMSAEELSAEVEEFKDRIKKKAEELVLHKFPRNVLELDKLLNTELFSLNNLSKLKCDPNIPIPDVEDASVVDGITTNHVLNNHEVAKLVQKNRKLAEIEEVSVTKGLALPNGVAPCNPYISEVKEVVKPKVIQLVEDVNLLKMWILFLIPRIEDGNNFGVSIQENTLKEVRTIEQEATTYFYQDSRYYIARGKIVAKIAKYPHVADLRRFLEEIDETEFLALRLMVCELRNHYATLHDLIFKNLEKIKKPRSHNTENMY